MQYRIKNENNEIMIFDFVIFQNGEIKKCIEFNGEQHYKPIDFFAEMRHLKNNKCEMLVRRSIVAPMQ